MRRKAESQIIIFEKNFTHTKYTLKNLIMNEFFWRSVIKYGHYAVTRDREKFHYTNIGMTSFDVSIT